MSGLIDKWDVRKTDRKYPLLKDICDDNGKTDGRKTDRKIS